MQHFRRYGVLQKKECPETGAFRFPLYVTAMPPKVKFPKEEIVSAALNVARRKGLYGVTTRDIAAELSISTRPIFTFFRSMDEVRDAIRDAARAEYSRYAMEGLSAAIPFYGFGMQYIRFAREEPELYRMLFLSSDTADNAMTEMERSKELARESLMRIYHMDATTADRYFRDLWLVVHGIATLIVTGACPYDDAEIGKILTGFSAAICKALKEIPGFAANEYDRDKVFRQILAE